MLSRKVALLTIVWGTTVAGSADAATYYASPNGADSNPGTYARPWRTLQAGKKVLKAGDTLLIADGHYPGGVRHSGSGMRGKPITYRAMNRGRAIIRGDQTKERDAFTVYESSWIVVDGLVLQGSKRGGVWVAGGTNVTVRNCISRNNGVWGIFTSYSDDLLIENNETMFNREQHGIYVSNSGDRPIVRNNVSYNNGHCGIQLNGDGKQVKPALGPRGDGIIANAVVEGNVLYGNGAAGGAALNLLSVRNSRIANNLICNNLAGGIALWNDNRKDALQWGSKNNLILSNTIHFRPNEGRWCISFGNGSTNNTVANNILSGGGRGAYQFDSTSSFQADYNLLFSASFKFAAVNEGTKKFLTAADYQRFTGNDRRSVVGDPKFVNAAGASPDFHLRTDSPARRAGMLFQGMAADAEGNPMRMGERPDIGCFGAAQAGATAKAGRSAESEGMVDSEWSEQPAGSDAPQR